jgi:hypothetical protein
MGISLLTRRRQRYIELDEESVAELRVIPTISLSWSSSSNSGSSSSGQASVEAEPQSKDSGDEQTNMSKATKIKTMKLWNRLRAALRKKRKQAKTDDNASRIGIAASPRQYLVSAERQKRSKSIKEAKSHYLKRRLKLLTICEDEEYDDIGLYEC